MYNVILTGTYSSYNKGDASMELCTAAGLSAVHSEIDVVLSVPFPEIDESFYSPLSVIRSTRRRLIFGTWQIVRALVWRWFRLFRLDLRKQLFNEELEAFEKADLIIDLSGDTLAEDYGVHVTYSHFLPILLGLAFGKKVFLCGQSIGPFRFMKVFAKFILNRVDYITARDTITRDYLENLDLSHADIDLTADMAFLLEPASKERSEEILANEGIPRFEKPVIGVSVSSLVEGIYLNENPRANELSYTEFMASFLDLLAEKYGCITVFFSHVTGPKPDKDDRIISRRLMARMKSEAYMLKGDYRPEEIKSIISQSFLFIGARMHANIAALSSGVPTITISYSHKSPGIMQLYGLNEYVCPVRTMSFDMLQGKESDLNKNREAVLEKLETVNIKMKQKAFSNIQIALELLGEKKAIHQETSHASNSG